METVELSTAGTVEGPNPQCLVVLHLKARTHRSGLGLLKNLAQACVPGVAGRHDGNSVFSPYQDNAFVGQQNRRW